MQEHGVSLKSPDRSTVKVPSHTRGKTGCLTCRRRKKRCDGSDGRCEQCRRLNLRCVWEAERDIVAAAARAAPSNTPDAQVALFKAPIANRFGLKVSDETANGWNRRLALRYYIQAFAAILSTNTENNGFLTGTFVQSLRINYSYPHTA